MDTSSATEPQAATAVIVARVNMLMDADIGDEALRVARHCVLDWFGVALAAAREPLVELLRHQVTHEGGNPLATLVGSTVKLSPRQAALTNGAMGHSLDYDDLHFGATCHVTAAVLPAALALAEAEGRSGRDLLRALVCGHEAAAMTGLLLGKAHYHQGFHNTGTVGCFGATAASAAVLGLRGSTMATALGLAGSQAAGLKAQFGTMAKPLHAGKAAESGVLAATLAQRGFTARHDILECPQGFASTHGAQTEPGNWAAPRTVPHIRDTIFKFSASCFGTHPSMLALAELTQRHGLRAADVRQVILRVDRSLGQMCNISAPSTGLEAKFSLRLNAALVLAGEDTSAPSLYTDATAARSDLATLRDRVHVHLMPEGWGELVAEAEIQTMANQCFVARHDASHPASDLAMQEERLRLKFRRLAGEAIGLERALRLEQTIDRLEQLQHLDELTR